MPFLGHPRPRPPLLRNEALAGLTVGLMMIPQSVAYAHLAGMPPITGIYASILPALVAVLFSSSQRLSVGPTALTALLIGASLSGMALPGSAQWVQLAVWLALLSGLLQVLLGWMHFGWLLNVVNAPVLMAFTQAAAVLIIASQLPSLLGFKGGWTIMWQAPEIHWPSTAFGVLALALLMGVRRWKPALRPFWSSCCLPQPPATCAGLRRTAARWWAHCPTGCPACTFRPGRAGKHWAS